MKRPSNLDRLELQRRARIATDFHGGESLVRVHYKYDCGGCHRRVKVAEPNVLPKRAKCEACGTWTTITKGGFDLVRRVSISTPWQIGAGALIIRTHDAERAIAIEIEP